MKSGDRQRLLRLMKDRAFREGDFLLTSGRRSSYYFDGRLVTLDPVGALLIGREMLGWAREDLLARVGGPTLGADPMVAAIAVCSAVDGGPEVGAFILRKEVKDHGVGGAFAGAPPTAGERVAIVDDALTTGGSLLTAAERVTATGALIVAVYTLLDREEGGRDRLEAAGYRVRSIFTRSELVEAPAVASPKPV